MLSEISLYPISDIPSKSIAALNNGTVYLYGSNNDQTIWMLNSSNYLSPITPQNGGPSARTYSAMIGYKNGFIMHGGKTATETLSDLWQYHGDNNTWTLLASNLFAAYSHKILLSYLNNDPILYFTGLEDNSINIYDINSQNLSRNYSPINSQLKPGGTGSLSFISTNNRLFLYGGKTSQGSLSNELWQFVDQRNCIASLSNCGTCVNTLGCGWCSSTSTWNLQPYCIAGSMETPYINYTCPTVTGGYLTVCPSTPEYVNNFLGACWITLMAMLVLGIFNFIIIKVRSVNRKPPAGYTAVIS
jgi:hypothetical protein